MLKEQQKTKARKLSYECNGWLKKNIGQPFLSGAPTTFQTERCSILVLCLLQNKGCDHCFIPVLESAIGYSLERRLDDFRIFYYYPCGHNKPFCFIMLRAKNRKIASSTLKEFLI